MIGGVHSDYDPRAIAALEAGGRLFSRDNLDSLMPGEAAAFFVLTRTGDAARYGLTPLATDLTFEMRRQYEWQSVWVRAQKVLGVPYLIDAPAQRIGYLGAAAMPLFACMARDGLEARLRAVAGSRSRSRSRSPGATAGVWLRN